MRRFECPESKSRWDAPLFAVEPHEAVPAAAVLEALAGAAAVPHVATMSAPLAAGDAVHELDRATQRVLSEVVAALRTALPGDSLPISDMALRIELGRATTMPELQRLRRQFLAYAKTHSLEGSGRVAEAFVRYLNDALRG